MLMDFFPISLYISAMPSGFVYILGSQGGTLYIGVTSNMEVRLAEHRSGDIPGFTSQYGCKRLLFLEKYTDIRVAIAREKQLKGWRRDKKLELIRKDNPAFQDLAELWGCLHIGPHQSKVETDRQLSQRIRLPRR